MKPYRNIQEAIWDFSDRIERLEAALKGINRRLDSIEEGILPLGFYSKYAIQGTHWSVHYFRFAYREKDGTLKTGRCVELHQNLAAY